MDDTSSQHSGKPKFFVIVSAIVGLVIAIFIAIAKYHEIKKSAAEAEKASIEAELARSKQKPKDDQTLDNTAVGPKTESPASPKPGAAAYDIFPEPMRSQLIKDWEVEIAAVKKAIKADTESLRTATTARERQRLQNWLKIYTERMENLELNNPPYLKKK